MKLKLDNMKTKIFKVATFCMFLSIAGGILFSACNNDIENEQIQAPYTYSHLYYQNLRDYKASDHSIAWMWFADYSQSHSLAIRFAGLPDSLDICSLWGGIPSDDSTHLRTFYNPKIAQEMHWVQKTKGTKMIVPTIIRIENKTQYGDEKFYKDFQISYEKGDTALRHRALEAYADYLLKPIFENDLDGIDLDYEPEGDKLSGENMSYFCKYIGSKIGPKSSKPEMLFCVDFYSQRPPTDVEPYVSYFVNQTYGGSPSNLGFPIEKTVFTENIGDNWQTGGKLLEYAAWEPSTGRKGGFGAFYGHRDYNLSPPYRNMRKGIQIQNPAIH